LPVFEDYVARDPLLDSLHYGDSADGDRFVDWKATVWATPSVARKGTSSVVTLIAWWLWKWRNAVIFNGMRPDLDGLLDTIKVDARSWVALGVSGLAAILPPA
jgi:hypothetical protein